MLPSVASPLSPYKDFGIPQFLAGRVKIGTAVGVSAGFCFSAHNSKHHLLLNQILFPEVPPPQSFVTHWLRLHALGSFHFAQPSQCLPAEWGGKKQCCDATRCERQLFWQHHHAQGNGGRSPKIVTLLISLYSS